MPVEVDELSSDDGDQCQEEEQDDDGREVESAMSMVVALLEQGQETQERILADLAQKGEVAQRVGRRMADDAHEALKKGRHEKARPEDEHNNRTQRQQPRKVHEPLIKSMLPPWSARAWSVCGGTYY